jgi:hypothetical protein
MGNLKFEHIIRVITFYYMYAAFIVVVVKRIMSGGINFQFSRWVGKPALLNWRLLPY